MTVARKAATQAASIRDLIAATRAGGITLVLGAGVSMPRGIPSWNALAQTIWDDVFSGRPSPWDLAKQGGSPQALPQFLPITFELAYRELGEASFVNTLRKHLYTTANLPLDDPSFLRSRESLAILARVIIAEHKRRTGRRITAVITFNADDFIEQAVTRIENRRNAFGFSESVRAVVRSTHSFLGRTRPRQVIPVYHIHGFLPAHGTRFAESYEHMLVFTDAQYWSTSASAFSFANRIMTSALSEGRCLFIGLSMTDINLLRWLALRTLDRDRDLSALAQSLPRARKSHFTYSRFMEKQFSRHFWIRPPSDDPSGFQADFLKLRGIQTVEIASWQDNSLAKLIARCFPAAGKTQ